MKKLFILLILGVIFSCHQEDFEEINLKELKDSSVLNQLDNDKGIPFPKGTKVFKKENLYQFELPDNVFYLLKNHSTQEFDQVSKIGVNCKCTSGSGCSPVLQGGNIIV